MHSQCGAMDIRHTAIPHAFRYRSDQSVHAHGHSMQPPSGLWDQPQNLSSAYLTDPVLSSPTAPMTSSRERHVYSHGPSESECAPLSWGGPLIATSPHARPSPVVNFAHDTTQTKSNLQVSRASINSGRIASSPPQLHSSRMAYYYGTTQPAAASTMAMDSRVQAYERAQRCSPALSSASSMNLGGDSYLPLTPDHDERFYSGMFSTYQSPISTNDEFAENHGNGDLNSEPYATLIYRALKSAPGHRMVLKEIYEWFERNTDKAKDTTSKGWQNSIRHNLSMNGVRLRFTELSCSESC